MQLAAAAEPPIAWQLERDVPKILFANRSFWPDTDATGVLLTELAEDLAVDHQITVICGPSNISKTQLWPLFRREFRGEVKIVRTFGARLSKRNLALRLANLCIYFVLASVAAFREHPDVIVAETDPPLLGVLGALVKRLKVCRFVYYCQDVYPDIAEATGGLRNRRLIAFLRRCNNFAYQHADAIVVLGSDMAERLRLKGVPPARIVVISNWIDCSNVTPKPMSIAWLSGGSAVFVVMYAGNLGLSQDLESILEAARLLRDDRRVRFVLVGDGTRKLSLQRRAKLDRLDNLEFIDRVRPSAMSEVLATGHLHLIPLAVGAAGCLVPSKVYGILAAGRPFVAMMEKEAEIARLATEFEVGFVVPPGDAVALAKTISSCMKTPRLLEEMGRRARALAEHSYDRRLVTRRFADLLETILHSPPAQHPADETDVERGEQGDSIAPVATE
jgi:colanic acid biosynthesis glycosyl transferase WcaI